MNRMSGSKRKADIPGIAFFRSETDRPHPVDPVHPVKNGSIPSRDFVSGPGGGVQQPLALGTIFEQSFRVPGLSE